MTNFEASLFYTPESAELRYLPECPLYLRNSGQPGRSLLGWVAIQHAADVLHGSLNILDLESRANRSIDLPGRPGFFAETTEPGTVAVGLDRRLILVKIHTGEIVETGLHLADTPGSVIINDGLAVPGGIVFGTKHLEFNQPIANLYYFDSATRTIQVIVDGQLCSNGKFCFANPDGTIALIDTDSMPKAITHYTFDKGWNQLLSRKPVVDPESLPAFPDGLRPGPDGSTILVALFNGEKVADGAATLFDIHTGVATAGWRIPGAPRVTCPEILPMDGKVKVLFVTATEGATAEHAALAPMSGCFFLADTPFETVPAGPPLVDIASLTP